jgi:hypothetical protein
MSRKRIIPRLLKLHRSYTVEETASKLGVHKNSVRSWIKSGLPIIDNTRPVLMLGSEMRAWLEKRRKEAKRPCLPGTLYCFKCRTPKPPALGMIEYRPINASTGNLSALCADCDTMMHRRTRRDTISAIMPNLDVQIREAAPSIIERTQPTLNCDNQMEA